MCIDDTFVVPFELNLSIKRQEEERNLSFVEKRLTQLNDFDPKVKAA